LVWRSTWCLRRNWSDSGGVFGLQLASQTLILRFSLLEALKLACQFVMKAF
jgi:hypothetical protein